jgi:hypothetical protein
MQDIEGEFLYFIDETHSLHGFETNFWALAYSLNITVQVDKQNSARFIGTLPLITLDAHEYERRQNFSKMHEVAHILLKLSRLERRLIKRYGSFEAAYPHIERLCNLGASRLLMPDSLVEDVMWPSGPTALAVYHLAELSQCTYPAALRRVVHYDDTASVAGFITSRGAVRDLTTTKTCRLPFHRAEVLPRSHPIFKAQENKNTLLHIGETDMHLLQIPHSQTRVGIVVATF